MIDFTKIELDENIRDSIIILNKKGYVTLFCCGGNHPEVGYIHIYIYFENDYPLPELPKGFKLKNRILEYFYSPKFDPIRHKTHFDDLVVWVESLPNLK